ncbi:unnamed protein product [Lathyrus sativus]|nr:unnamed protein product [Lathyrus sativus]
MTPMKDDIVPQLTMQEKSSLPLKNVAKIMRKGLPPHIKISDGAKELAEQSASKFISMVTKKATERCIKESRKILGAEDLLWAMMSLGYHNYAKGLSFYLQRYRYSNGIMPRQLVCEIPKHTLPSPPVALEPNSWMNGKSSIEIDEEVNIDEFWDELSDLGDGSLGSCSADSDPSTLFNIGAMFDESIDKMKQ